MSCQATGCRGKLPESSQQRSAGTSVGLSPLSLATTSLRCVLLPTGPLSPISSSALLQCSSVPMRLFGSGRTRTHTNSFNRRHHRQPYHQRGPCSAHQYGSVISSLRLRLIPTGATTLHIRPRRRHGVSTRPSGSTQWKGMSLLPFHGLIPRSL